jgi:hypothetical protein
MPGWKLVVKNKATLLGALLLFTYGEVRSEEPSLKDDPKKRTLAKRLVRYVLNIKLRNSNVLRLTNG